MDEKQRITPAAVGALARGDIENFIVASTPGGIEAQEAAGQKEFVSELEILPIDGTIGGEGIIRENRKAWESLGFEFADPPDDDIFVKVKFPDGWTKKPTGHSMWSDLLDDQGRVRASMFYKAAFYDRSAHATLSRRFSIGYLNDEKYNVTGVVLTDSTGLIEKSFGEVPINTVDHDKDEKGYRKECVRLYDIQEGMRNEGIGWLAENYPDHENLLAYWETEEAP